MFYVLSTSCYSTHFQLKKKEIMLLYTIFKIIIRVNYNLLIYGLTEI